MSDVSERIKHLNELVRKSLQELRRLKAEHESLRVDVGWNAGSVLNGYREGDLSFTEAVQRLNEWNIVRSELLEGDAK